MTAHFCAKRAGAKYDRLVDVLRLQILLANLNESGVPLIKPMKAEIAAIDGDEL